MKFLFILADKFPLFRVDLTVLFAKELVKLNYEIEWVMPTTKNNFFTNVNWEGGKAFLAANFNSESIIIKLLNYIFLLVNDLRALFMIFFKKYDFIQVKDRFVPVIFFAIACRLRRIPIFFWISYPFPEAYLHFHQMGHNKIPYLNYLRGHFLIFLTYKCLCPIVDHIFVQSQQMLEDMKHRGVPENKMTTVPMGVDIEVIKKIEKVPSLDIGSDILVYTGIFYKVRRLEFLFDVLSKVRESEPNTLLYMIGEAESSQYDTELKKTIFEKSLNDAVIFTGFVEFKKMLQYLKTSSLCVSAYYPTFVLNSTSPTKLIEYMAMGKASVVTEHPEQKQLIEESNGGLCVPYDVEAMATAIIHLLKNPNTAKEMGVKAQEYIINNRSYKVIANQLDNTYKKLMH